MERRSIDSITKEQEITYKREVDRFRPFFYAGASGDFNPIHIDAEFARAAGFKNVILHGMCTMAFMVEGLVEWAGGDPGALKSVSVRFSRPVNIDDTITFRHRITGIDGNMIKLEGEAENQDGDKVLKNVEAELELSK